MTANAARASERESLGRIIWETSHRDEGTISATGANIIADAILAAGFGNVAEAKADARDDVPAVVVDCCYFCSATATTQMASVEGWDIDTWLACDDHKTAAFS